MTDERVIDQEPTVHLRFDGESIDVGFSQLDLGDASTDMEVKAALAEHCNVPIQKLANYQVDRHETGNITVRPEAVFG